MVPCPGCPWRGGPGQGQAGVRMWELAPLLALWLCPCGRGPEDLSPPPPPPRPISSPWGCESGGRAGVPMRFPGDADFVFVVMRVC